MTIHNKPNKNLVKSRNRFVNRELSWLFFNERVLEEASNKSHPLLERLKFLAISASNLDEFFMVRVAGLRNQVRNNIQELSLDGLTPVKQIELVHLRTRRITREQQTCWEEIREELQDEGIDVLFPEHYTKEDIEWLKIYFSDKILPNLGRYEIEEGKRKNVPLLPNKGRAFILSLIGKNRRKIYGFMPVPENHPRFIKLPDNNGGRRFTTIDDVISFFRETIFPGSNVTGAGFIRIIRDSELQISDKADDLLLSFEKALKNRSLGNIIRVKTSTELSPDLRKFVAEFIGIDRQTIIQGTGFLGLSDIAELYNISDNNGQFRPDLKFPELKIRFPERINDFGGDCFAAIEAKDIIVHHPYESFDVVVQFIRQAAKDPHVTEIKQTLYRTSSDSIIVQALIEAAEAGKKVTVVVELKARFDEEANIKWGRGLQKAGAKVIFGIAGLKTHAKVALIKRKVGDTEKSYVHYGTGNYHPVTAKTYTDLSFFTCDPALCRDAEKLFGYMQDLTSGGTGGLSPKKVVFEKIFVSPLTLRTSLLKLIEKEKENAEIGLPAGMWIKVNSVVDNKLIDALYGASSKNVQIEMVIRGICCLRPGVPKLSENIKVKSMIGRFLEHARIYCFGNGHPIPSPENKVFISSADMMYRNMERRIECMIPVENPTVHEQVLSQVMAANIRDRKQSWIMQLDGTYKRMKWKDTSFSAHEFFVSNPSLSGRGSALRGPVHSIIKKHEEVVVTKSMQKIAVVDIGSNSVRMVIYDGLKRVPLPLLNEKVLCGLARDIDKTGLLNKDGVKMANNALDRFFYIISAMEVSEIFCFATSAVRDSQDGKLFVRAIEKKYGIKIKVLSGMEEARFAALGVASSFYEAEGVVGDLGGGSLELSQINWSSAKKQVDTEGRIVGVHNSFPLGSLRLQSATIGKKSDARNIINAQLGHYPLKELLKGRSFFAVGGGFRALAKLHITLNEYPLSIIHAYKVTAEELTDTLKLVSYSSPSKIALLPTISESRVETLSFTALVLECIIKIGNPENIIFSSHGVREGILFERLSPEIIAEDALISGCSDMVAGISRDNTSQWTDYGRELCDWMSPLFKGETTYMRRLRLAACMLSWIAWYEHTAYRAEVAFRWVLDSELPAVDHWERVFIATAIFHRYKTDNEKTITGRAQAILERKWINRARIIGLAMRFGHAFSGSTSGILTKTFISAGKKKLIFSCHKDDKVLLGADVIRRLGNLASAMDLSLEITLK